MNSVFDIKVSPRSFVSLHVQIQNQLRQLITSGQWPHSSQLPSEKEFVHHLKVSRSTVRLALQRVEIEGLIQRFPGRGTFVVYQASQVHAHPLVALVAAPFDSDGLLWVLNGAEGEGRARGYQIILKVVQSQDDELGILQGLKKQNVAGVLIWPRAEAARSNPHTPTTYGALGLPIVAIDRQIYGIGCDFVTSDHYAGASALMQHLIELGHQNIVFFSHDKTHLFAVQERYRAYCDVLQSNGFQVHDPWLTSNYLDTKLNGNEALRLSSSLNDPEVQRLKDYLQTSQPRPTAIFALSDNVAIMAMSALKILDIRVPNDMSVVGFDDIDLAGHLEVPLTTVAQDYFMLGKQAASRLFDRLEGYSGSSVCEVIPTQLRIRASTSVPLSVLRR
jgi:GntR family transcriptional regulator of arabinose operon